MPELPEVEVVRRGVESWAAGRAVTEAQVHDARSLRRYAEGPEHFRRVLIGRTLLAPERRGKFLWIPLGSETEAAPSQALMIHLGMSGQVLMEAAEAPLEKHLKVTLHLGAPTQRTEAADDGAVPDQLRFVDQRIFGGMQISPLVPDSVVQEAQGVDARRVLSRCGAYRPGPAGGSDDGRALLPHPAGAAYGPEARPAGSGDGLGVGNIYADEALWRSRLHYARRTETMTRAQASLLLASLQDVMGMRSPPAPASTPCM